MSLKDRNNFVLEAKYQAIHPPLLNSLSPEELFTFLERYDRYISLNEKMPEDSRHSACPLKECVSSRVLRVLQFKHPDVLASDETFREYIKSETRLTQFVDISSALSQLIMDMKIPNVKSRLSDYDIRFLELKDRCEDVKLKPKIWVKSYIEGIRPISVKKTLEGALAYKEFSLEEIIELAEEKLLANDEDYKLRRNIPKDDPKLPKPGKNPDSKPGIDTQGSAAENASSSRPKRENAGVCKLCKGKWSPEHWTECLAAHNKGKLKKAVNAVDMTCHNENLKNLELEASDKLDPIHVPVIVGDYEFKALLDCGAAVSCISSKLLKRLVEKVPVKFSAGKSTARMPDSTKHPIRYATFILTLPTGTVANKVTLSWSFAILPDEELEQMLLGRDLTPSLGVVEDFKAIGDKLRIIKIDRDAEVQKEMNDDLDDSVMEINTVIQTSNNDDSEQALNDYRAVKIHPSPIAEELRKLVEEYQDIFIPELHPDGADFPPFKIKLIRDEVICVPPRSIKPALRAIVHQKIHEMRLSRLVDEAKGPWSNAAVIVVRSNKVRICGDYVDLNDITEAHVFPLPDIRKMMQALGGNYIFGKLDLLQGFHQMLMDPESAAMTAIRTPDDYIFFLRCPFGVKNGPMEFQERMHVAFSELLYKHLGIFIDDIFMYDNTNEGFLKTTRRTFDICRNKRLRLRANKCELGAPSIVAVGYDISGEGRRLSAERVSAVRNLPIPKDQSELRGFLGSVNYFHEFVPNLAVLASPLNHLLRKGVNFEWTDECQKAYELLKDAITSEEIMAFGTEPGEIVLRSDASGIGIGGVLLLRAEGRDRPITYYSKTLTGAQRHWSTIEQELYALVYGVTLGPYRDLLKLRSFTCETDHRNLVWLEKIANNGNPKLQRWRMLLMQYDFKIIHIPGFLNVVADVMSRMGHDISNGTSASSETVDMTGHNEIPVHSICSLDVSSDIIDRIRDSQKSLPFDNEKWANKHVYDANFKLWYTPAGQLIVPKDASDIKSELFHAAHGSPFQGHLGIERTCRTIQDSGYYWTNMPVDVGALLKQCPTCQKFRDIQDVTIDVRSIHVDKPFVALHIDSMGPFPTDKRGNQYVTAMIDPFTHYIRLGGMPDLTSFATADLIYTRVFLEHGLPLVLSSDNGTQFVNHIIEDLLELLKVKHHKIIPYHPQANGIIERANEEILKHLRCLVPDFAAHEDWSEYIPLIEYILNHTVQTSTGVTPYCMLYGRFENDVRDPLQPIQASLEKSIVPELLFEDEKGENYVQALKQRLSVIHAGARRAYEIAKEKKNTRDSEKKNSTPTTYREGDYVLLVRPHDQKPRKLAPRLLGPFKVIAHRDGQVLYKVQSLIDPSDIQQVHTERMRPFQMENDIPLAELKRFASADIDEYVVENVLAHRGDTKNSIEFLIHWSGYPDSEDTWEPYANCKCEQLDEYLREHPEARKIVNARKARASN